MISEQHPDDPTRPPHEHRVYGDDMAQSWAVVDEIDYQWAIRHRWHVNKPHPARKGKKQYFCRSNGSGGRSRGPRLFLHVEIMKRKGVPPPDAEHTIVGHIDDDEWNCRRDNLEWTTYKKNRKVSQKANKNWENLRNDRKSRKNVQAG